MPEHDTIVDPAVAERLDALEERMSRLEAGATPSRWWWPLGADRVYDVAGFRHVSRDDAGHLTHQVWALDLTTHEGSYDPEQLRALRGTGWDGDLDEMRHDRARM